MAVVLGQAGAAFATPTTPTAEVAISESLTPVLHGASHGATGSDTLHFYARTHGAATWDLVNNAQLAGPSAYKQLPGGQLSIGQSFDYQITDCDSGGCTSSAVLTSMVSPALGAGQRPGGTRVPFTVGDNLSVSVDVGSGNLLINQSEFSLPRRNGSTLGVGLAYNSVTRVGTGAFSGTIAPGWRLTTGTDVKLKSISNGAVVYYGPSGLTGTFFPDGGGGFTPPTGFKMTLATVSGGGWTLNDHGSGDTYHFNSTGRLTSITDRTNTNRSTGAVSTTFNYNSNNVLATISSDRGTAGANTLTVNRATPTSTQITGFTQIPDSGSGLTSRSVSYTYDPTTGYLTGITDALGRTTSFGYAPSNLNTITAPGGAQTSISYDGSGRVTKVTQPTANPAVNAVTRFQYNSGQTLLADPDSNQSQSVSAAAHTTYALTTDGQLLVSSVTDPLGHTQSKTYNSFNDTLKFTDATGQQTQNTFGANGGESLTKTQIPTNATTQAGYTGSGNTAYEATSGTDSQNNSSTYTYDTNGNGLSAADAGNNTASVTRNLDGTVATSKVPLGAVTNYGYDSNGQQTSMTPPANGGSLGQRTYTYDGFGRLATITGGRGITTTYSYDAGDRITSVAYSDSTHTVSYTYNPAGQVATRVDASGTTTYGYDPLGRLTSRSNTVNSGGVSYTYDPAGNISTAVNAAGTTTYTYNAGNLVTKMVPPDNQPITFGYDDNNRRIDTTFNAGTDGYGSATFAAHTHTTYDNSGRVTEQWTSEGSNDATKVTDMTYSYAYDNDGGTCPTSSLAAGVDTGLRWVVQDKVAGTTTHYCYDSSNRLTVADVSGVGATKYAYDADGNRKTITDPNGTVSQSLTFNAQDQISSNGLTYDADGNTTTGLHATFTYNGANQMTSITTSGTGYFTWAGANQDELITDTLGRNFTYGRTSQTGLPLMESFTQGGSTFSYLYDPDGTPLAIEGTNTHYLALDPLHSVLATIKADGTTSTTYSYDAWGTQTTTAQNSSTIGTYQIYGFAGGTTDPSTNEHFGHRWYYSGTGRFTQQDDINTLGDPSRANRYEYAGDNPTNYVDPTGRLTADQLISGIISGALGTIAGTLALPLTPIGAGFVGGCVGSASYSYLITGGSTANVGTACLEAGVVGAGAAGLVWGVLALAAMAP